MKKLFLFLMLIGFFTLSACGSTQNCRTRTSADNFKNIKKNLTDIASVDIK